MESNAIFTKEKKTRKKSATALRAATALPPPRGVPANMAMRMSPRVIPSINHVPINTLGPRRNGRKDNMAHLIAHANLRAVRRADLDARRRAAGARGRRSTTRRWGGRSGRRSRRGLRKRNGRRDGAGRSDRGRRVGCGRRLQEAATGHGRRHHRRGGGSGGAGTGRSGGRAGAGARVAAAGRATRRSSLEIGSVAIELHAVARVGELDVLALGQGAGVARGDVGDEHIREAGGVAHGKSLGRRGEDLASRNLVALLGASSHRDGSAVHVHFAVANLIEPGPSEDVVAGGDALGDAEVESAGAGAVRVFGQVAGGVDGAAAFDGVDDHPVRGFGGGLVGCQGELARATAVDGRAGKGEGLVDADGHGVGGAFGIVNAGTLLAGEVGAVGDEGRVVERRFAKGRGGLHDHMSFGGAHEGQGRDDDGRVESDTHVGGVCVDEIFPEEVALMSAVGSFQTKNRRCACGCRSRWI